MTRAAARCPVCQRVLFTYAPGVAEPVVRQMQAALILAPAEARAVLGGKSPEELMPIGLAVLDARCEECAP